MRKKIHVKVLISGMMVAMLGMLAMQWFYVHNSAKLQEAQFQRDVKEAIIMATQRLQDRETAMIVNMAGLHEMLGPEFDHFMSRSYIPDSEMLDYWTTKEAQSLNGQRTASASVQNEDNGIASTTSINGNLPPEKMEEISEKMDQQMQYFKEISNRIMLAALPLKERLNHLLLDTLLTDELQSRGISERFLYEVNAERNLLFPAPSSPHKVINPEKPFFRAALFPRDIGPRTDFIDVQFPDHQNPVWRSVGLMLPSAGVIMVVVVLFGIVLLAWQRQQKLSLLKTDFINNMTHELKTPISTISLALEALGDPDMQSPESIGMYTKLIRQENDRLKSQVERVLQAAAFERGELKLIKEEVDVAELTQEEVDRIRIHVERRSGKIDFQNEATDSLMQADRIHLAGIIFNLLDNANKYSPDTPDIEVRLRNRGEGIELEVKDKGLGMSRDAQKMIFEKFYRVPTGDLHDVKGFGLGLSYVKSIVEAHKGQVKLQSDLGKGSTFSIYLPKK